MSNTDSIALYGTDEILEPARMLRAGPLSAELEDGNLRHIRYQGVEVLRAVSFIVRDRNWGTYRPVITALDVQETGNEFRVSYRAETSDDTGDETQRFSYVATIHGTASGVHFQAQGEAITDFLTNRTGFVVLHPIDGVAGSPVTIERVDGTVEESRFPELIDPVQPMMDLRTLTHQPAPGLRASCRMEGDTFEMEDQRNWTDASYKTYVRPLALPWPYTLEAGVTLEQSVSLTLKGGAAHPGAETTSGRACSLTLGELEGRQPDIGIGLPCEEVKNTLSAQDALLQLGASHVVVHYDTARGHELNSLRDAAALATTLGQSAWLEVVVHSVEHFAEELNILGEAVAQMGSPFSTVLVSPAPDMNCTLPGSEWPPTPEATALYEAARRAFKGAQIGGGMFSYFTELNRKRPPLAPLDLVGFTTSAIVHAGDDVSVMENLSSLSFIGQTARQIAGNKPISVGPSAIGMRMNPYGDAPMENPHNIRQAMNRNDPRQRSLLGAAWAVGYQARLNDTASAICFGATTGAHGLVHTPQAWPQPWFDEHGGLYPQFHAVRALARMAGSPRRNVTPSDATLCQAVACETADGIEMLVANPGAEPCTLTLPSPVGRWQRLDASCFAEASADAAFLDKLQTHGQAAIELDGFAIARLLLDHL